MSKLLSCSTGTQTPLISSCLSSVVSGNWGEEGTWQGDMFEPSFEGNHVFECRGCLLQLPQQAVRRRSLVRGPDCCQVSPCYSRYPWGRALRPAWGNRERSLLHIMFGVKQALDFVFLRPNRKATSKWLSCKQAGLHVGWGLLVVESWRVESRSNGCDYRQGYKDGVAASASSVMPLLWERSAGICQASSSQGRKCSVLVKWCTCSSFENI